MNKQADFSGGNGCLGAVGWVMLVIQGCILSIRN